MEAFFENNIYVLFALIIYYILMSDKPKEDNKKMVIIYIFISMLSLFDVLDLKSMLLILLICLFLYFEILIEDSSKLLILRKIFYKLIDFLYLLIFKYYFLFYVVSLIFISDTFSSKIGFSFIINFLLFFLILIYVITKIISNEFELENFSTIHRKLSKYDFNNFKFLTNNQIEIVTFLEDKSFFERANDYTFLCWDFIKYRLDRINEVVTRIQEGKNRRHPISRIFIFIGYVFKQLYLQISDIRGLGRCIRGYSTIDMQLFRSISVKNGYTKTFDRKIAELVYSQLFFKGLKCFYKLNYKRVSSGRFKNFLLLNYIEYAPIFINGKQTYISVFWNKSIDCINDSEFFLSILCFPGKISVKKLSFKYIMDNFEWEVNYFGLDRNELRKAIKEMKVLAKSI